MSWRRQVAVFLEGVAGRKPRILPLACCAALAGCAAHTNLEPLGAGRLAPHASFGGPVVKAFGVRVPVPYVVAGADLGIGGRINGSANLHLLPLAYEVGGVDAGLTWFPVLGAGHRPTIGLESRLLVFASWRSGVDSRVFAYPAFAASAAWRMAGKTVYTGTDLAVPLADADYDPQPAGLIASPFAGVRWGGGQVAWLTELKWHGVNVRSDQLAVTYWHPAGRGALTLLVAAQRRF